MRLGQIDEPNFSWIDFIKAIWFLLESKRKPFLFFNSMLFVIMFYDLLPPLIVGKIVDFFTHYKTGTSLVPFYIMVAILGFGQGIISFTRLTLKYVLSKIGNEVNYYTRVKGFEKLLDFSLRWHDSENTGNKVQKIQNGTSATTQLRYDLGNDIFPQTTAIIGVLIAYLFINPLFFLVGLFYMVMFIIIQASFYKRLQQMNNEYNLLLEKASGTYYEGLSNILTIKTLGVKGDFKKNITSREELTRDFGIRMAKFNTDKWKLFQAVNGLSVMVLLLLVGNQYLSHLLTLGSIFVIYNYYIRLTNGANEWSTIFGNLVSEKISIARMMPIFWDKAVVKEGTKQFPSYWETLQLKNATFLYKSVVEEKEQTKEALKDISLVIKKFEKVGVVGKSGSGKSTLAKLLLGLYELESGEYLLGQTSFYDIKHDEATKHISLVLQDSEMFNLSLKDNITLMRKFDTELFTKAITISQLEELIKQLPEGVDTMIGEKGYRLSGGERQRIGIARAIYKDPQILVLDEATSSLDNKTEQLIQEALEKELSKKTVISIAHRVSTLRNVDRIIVFEIGQIVEEGKFKELEENKESEFYKIYKQQEKKKS